MPRLLSLPVAAVLQELPTRDTLQAAIPVVIQGTAGRVGHRVPMEGRAVPRPQDIHHTLAIRAVIPLADILRRSPDTRPARDTADIKDTRLQAAATTGPQGHQWEGQVVTQATTRDVMVPREAVPEDLLRLVEVQGVLEVHLVQEVPADLRVGLHHRRRDPHPRLHNKTRSPA